MQLQAEGPNVPVLVFTFVSLEKGIGRSMFLRMREKYEDMIAVLLTKMPKPDIAYSTAPIHRVRFRLYITNLAVCNGREVEVDEDAWGALIVDGNGAVSEVIVKVDVQYAQPGEEDKENRKPLSVRPIVTAPPPPRTPTKTPNVKGKAAETYLSPRIQSPRLPAGAPPPRASDLFGSDDHVTEEHTQRPDDEEDADEEEEEEEEEEDNDEEPEAGPSSQDTGKSWEDVGYDQEDEEERKPQENVAQAASNKFKPKMTEDTPVHIPTQTQDKDRKPPKEDVEEPKKAQDGDADPRFKVTIYGPDRETQRATLMTRGKYPARKVLNAVCKSFGIRVGNAQLLLLIPIDEDMEEQYICDPDETMSQNGVAEGARLVVKLVDEEDTEQSEEDE